jgi:tRNA modification GTPase
LREQVIEVESLIAYDIDFPEEDDGPVTRERVIAAVETLLASLDALLSTIPVGELIREGAVVVIAGLPNAGKSSLFNALLGQSRAIVTEIPGTTRDAIEASLETENWPVRLVDTAGLRESRDIVERIGIEVSEKYVGRANIVLACGDSDETLSAVLLALDGKTDASVIRVRTKSDLKTIGDESSSAAVEVSAENGEGLSALMQEIDSVLSDSVGQVVADSPILMRSRQIQGITQARSEIAAFQEAWKHGDLPAPVAAVHLRSASVALESLIGAVSTEDVLDRVFSAFCVGK